MSLMLAAALLFPAGPASAEEVVALPENRKCSDPRLQKVKSGGAAKLKRLGDLPQGEAIYAVERRMGSCAKPVLVRDERRK